MDIQWPHSLEIERAILGACFIDAKYLTDATRDVTTDDFHVPRHRRIFQAMLALQEDGEAIDILTVNNRLPQEDDDLAYLSRLMDGIPRIHNIPYYAGVLIDHSKRREVMKLGAEMLNETADAEHVDEFAASCQDRLKGLRASARGARWMPLGSILGRAVDGAESAAARHGALRGVTSGFTDLDDKTDGWQNGQLVIVAGTSGMGKTAVMLHFALGAAKAGKPVAFVSLEMGEAELGRRLFGVESDVPAQPLKRGTLADYGWAKIEHGIRRMKSLPLYLDDPDAMPTVAQIAARCRALQAEKGLGLVVVDYLQLVLPPKGLGSREQEVTSIGRGLKSMARALRVPVIAGCQLSKEADKRAGRPQRGDLRESGAIAHDADVLLFVYREWLQLKRLGAAIPDKVHETGGMLIIDKQRDGQEDVVPIRWNPVSARYEPLTSREPSGVPDVNYR